MEFEVCVELFMCVVSEITKKNGRIGFLLVRRLGFSKVGLRKYMNFIAFEFQSSITHFINQLYVFLFSSFLIC